MLRVVVQKMINTFTLQYLPICTNRYELKATVVKQFHFSVTAIMFLRCISALQFDFSLLVSIQFYEMHCKTLTAILYISLTLLLVKKMIYKQTRTIF